MVKYRIVNLDENELVVITENGGVVCIRTPKCDNDTDVVAISEYYQSYITDEMTSTNIFDILADGKVYYNDWNNTQCSGHTDEKLVGDALNWLGCVDCVRDDSIFGHLFN